MKLKQKREVVAEFLAGDQISVIESRERYYETVTPGGVLIETRYSWLDIECALREYMQHKFSLLKRKK